MWSNFKYRYTFSRCSSLRNATYGLFRRVRVSSIPYCCNCFEWSDSSNVSSHSLHSYVTVEDYHEGKDILLDLSSYRQVFALPGEHLGMTYKAFHQIKLQPGSQPIYVPSYRLPHSQRIQVEEMVRDKSLLTLVMCLTTLNLVLLWLI